MFEWEFRGINGRLASLSWCQTKLTLRAARIYKRYQNRFSFQNCLSWWWENLKVRYWCFDNIYVQLFFSFHRLQVITYLLKRKYLHWEMFWYWRRERGPQLCVRKWPGAATTVQTSSSGLLNFPSWFYFPWKSSQQGTITFPYLLSFKHHVTIFSTYLWTYFHDAPNVFILIKRKQTGIENCIFWERSDRC